MARAFLFPASAASYRSQHLYRYYRYGYGAYYDNQFTETQIGCYDGKHGLLY